MKELLDPAAKELTSVTSCNRIELRCSVKDFRSSVYVRHTNRPRLTILSLTFLWASDGSVSISRADRMPWRNLSFDLAALPNLFVVYGEMD